MKIGPRQERILKYLKLHRDPLRTSEVALAMGLPTHQASVTLRRMLKLGYVVRDYTEREAIWRPNDPR